MTLSSEPSDKYFIIIIEEMEATILGNEGSDSLVVFLKLDSDALSDGGVRLFGLNSNLFYNNSSSMGCSSEGVGLVFRAGVGFAV
jgi:hypothetical protein